MKNSEDVLKKDTERALVSRELRALQLQRLEQLFNDLVVIKDELWVTLNEADFYALAVEKLLEGKLTPTRELSEFRERLSRAKRKLADLKEELHGFEEFLDSVAKER